jgi:hypothetical protein
MTDWVWYAAYGSNLSQDRFACYLGGGRPEGASVTYQACTDPTPPRRTARFRLRGRLRFGGESLVWGGGLAYLDSTAPGQVLARGYLVTTEQLDEVFELERRYDVRSRVADHEGLPVIAFTSTARHEPAAPSAPYLRTILTGLTDGLLDIDDAIAYVLAAEGVDQVWDAPTIRALVSLPRSSPAT